MTDKPLKITSSTVRKVRIENAPNLDPIDVFLEDHGPKQGTVTVRCYGRSWTTYWGAMWEGMTVADFFVAAPVDYIADRFHGGYSFKNNYAALPDVARKLIIERRRGRNHDYDSLMKDDARELYDMVETIMYDDNSPRHEVMEAIFGCEWWHNIPTMPDPDYEYVTRIIIATKDGLRQLLAAQAKPEEAANV